MHQRRAASLAAQQNGHARYGCKSGEGALALAWMRSSNAGMLHRAHLIVCLAIPACTAAGSRRRAMHRILAGVTMVVVEAMRLSRQWRGGTAGCMCRLSHMSVVQKACCTTDMVEGPSAQSAGARL